MSVNIEQLKSFRKDLHAHPEVSGHEKRTAEQVQSFIQGCQPDRLETAIGGYGILASWDSGKPGPEVVFRAELDALPIQEINTFDHLSKYKGVSHKCGHDGHTTILCGLAQYLQSNRPAIGTVHLLFQAAEENGEGAAAFLADERMQNFKPDFVFALHNLPSYPMHQLVVKENSFTAAVNSIIIYLDGKTSHAAEPEHGINPALTIAQILKESLAFDYNKPEQEDMRVVTPVYIEMGEQAYGISAGHASIHLTLRCWSNTHLRQLEKDIESVSLKIAEEHQIRVRFEYTQSFHANINHSDAVQAVKKAAMAKNIDCVERAYPFKWGEDFGLFTSQFKGCMFGLGAGENTPALHNPDYDFPDQLIDTGIQIFSGISDELVAGKQHV